MPPQIDATAFTIKMAGIAGAAVLVLIYFGLRSWISGNRFLSSGQHDEVRLLESGRITLQELQAGPWQFNANVSATLSSFGLGTIILAIVFLFEQRLTGFDALFFNLILGVFGVSVLAYFLGLQMWFLALDAGGSIYSRLRYRQRATTFQAIGWIMMLLAVLLAAMLVNTLLGYIFSPLAALSIIFIYEYKGNISLEDEAREASLNEFQQGIDPTLIYLKNQAHPLDPPEQQDTLRIMSWNIERGYDLAAIVSTIQQINPDIACLQEADWHNERTGSADVLEQIARETGMLGLFGVEFFEIQTPHRSPQLAGGGVHGNAILTRFPPVKTYRVELPQPFNWASPPKSHQKFARREKRQGGRFALCAEFEINSHALTVCSAHLEDKHGGVAGRYHQFQHLIDKIKSRAPAGSPTVIGGDLNTLDTWLARLGRFSSRHQARGKPWVRSECRWWKEELLPGSGYTDPFTCRDWTFKALGIYRQKLDWILTANCRIVDQGLDDFNTSDHRPLWVDVALESFTPV